jgi:hypothetical protein
MKTVTVLLLLTTFLVGCSASAQLVRADPTGGRIALRGPFMPAMSEAHLLMAEHCGSRFDAIEHGQDVLFQCRRALPASETTRQSARDNGTRRGL